MDRNALSAFGGTTMPDVALRKESVDRNSNALVFVGFFMGRSPQGERG